MLIRPILKTNKTKLFITSAYHMVASLGPLNEHLTTRTSFPLFEIHSEILVTFLVWMGFHHTLMTEYGVAFLALRRNFFQIYYTLFTCLDRTQLNVRVLYSLSP